MKVLKKEPKFNLSLRPIDIALSIEKHEGISVQNQLKGKVNKSSKTMKVFFVL